MKTWPPLDDDEDRLTALGVFGTLSLLVLWGCAGVAIAIALQECVG